MKKSIGFEIKEINDLIIKRMSSCLKCNQGCNVSHTQVRIISYLNKENIVYQRDIEQKFNLKRSTVSGILDTMEKNNLIKRINSKDDLRLKQIVLTEYAINQIHKIKNEIKRFDKQLQENIDISDLEIYFKVSEQIKKNIMKEDK